MSWLSLRGQTSSEVTWHLVYRVVEKHRYITHTSQIVTITCRSKASLVLMSPQKFINQICSSVSASLSSLFGFVKCSFTVLARCHCLAALLRCSFFFSFKNEKQQQQKKNQMADETKWCTRRWAWWSIEQIKWQRFLLSSWWLLKMVR